MQNMLRKMCLLNIQLHVHVCGYTNMYTDKLFITMAFCLDMESIMPINYTSTY